MSSRVETIVLQAAALRQRPCILFFPLFEHSSMPADRSASSTYSAELDLVSHVIKLWMARHMLQVARGSVPDARPVQVVLQQLCTTLRTPGPFALPNSARNMLV
jgi:hypothetical protein